MVLEPTTHWFAATKCRASLKAMGIMRERKHRAWQKRQHQQMRWSTSRKDRGTCLLFFATRLRLSPATLVIWQHTKKCKKMNCLAATNDKHVKTCMVRMMTVGPRYVEGCLKISATQGAADDLQVWSFTRRFWLAARTPDGCLYHPLADEGGQASNAVALPRQSVCLQMLCVSKGTFQGSRVGCKLARFQDFRYQE